MKCLEGKTVNSSPPSDCDSRSPRSSDWPHDDHSGPSRPADSHSDTAGGRGSGPSYDRSTGIVVTLSDGAAVSTWPHDGHSGKQLGLGDWYCTQETNFSQMHLPEPVACLVK